jgi:hypothetical protein
MIFGKQAENQTGLDNRARSTSTGLATDAQDWVAVVMSQPDIRSGRDEKLVELLPLKDAAYDYNKLSQTEMDALVEALRDGFGEQFDPYRRPMPLPKEIKTQGLLEHPFYCRPELYYNEQEWDGAFWSSDNGDDAPAPNEGFPLNFQPRRLRIYFQNQFERFCKKILREGGIEGVKELDTGGGDWVFDYLALERLYEKPWYEFHALQFLDWMENEDILKRPGLALLVNTRCAGQLGRLVEQYYWRFRFEAAAITGVGARKGASAGGRAKAVSHHTVRAAWQKKASEIWAHRPDLSKVAVAQKIRMKIGKGHTAKHIARYITRPSNRK